MIEQLQQFLRDPEGRGVSQADFDVLSDNQSIADAYNTLPDRYQSIELTFKQLGDALVANGSTPDEAIALANRLIADVTVTSQNNAVLGGIFEGFLRNDAKIDFASPVIRSQLIALTQEPDGFTQADLALLLPLIPDRNGGDVTAQDVADANAENTAQANREFMLNQVNTLRILGERLIDEREVTTIAELKAQFEAFMSDWS